MGVLTEDEFRAECEEAFRALADAVNSPWKGGKAPAKRRISQLEHIAWGRPELREVYESALDTVTMIEAGVV